MNEACTIARQKCCGVCNLRQLSIAAQWDGAGLGVALAKLLYSDTAGVSQCLLVSQSMETGNLQNTGSDTYYTDALAAQFLCLGTGQGVYCVFGCCVNALSLGPLKTGLGGHIDDHALALF